MEARGGAECEIQLRPSVKIPTIVIHGDLDEMSPIDQAVAAHRACGSSEKKLVRYPRAGHNDVRLLAKKDYFREVQILCERVVSGSPQVVQAPEATWLNTLSEFFSSASAMKCMPGIRRCFVNSADDINAETPRTCYQRASPEVQA
eukprot:symbB.v1.2.015147.t1/scaffold1124.1/size136573/13